MVEHAWATVPFYRKAMETRKLTPDDFQSANDLHKLPLICRDELLARPEAFFSSPLSRDRCFRIRTTGTSGVPAEFWHDHRSMVLNVAYGRRENAVLDGWIRRRRRRLTVAFRHPDSEYQRVQDFYRRALPRPFMRIATPLIATTADPVERNVELLCRVRPAIVSAHGSYLGTILLHPAFQAGDGWRPDAAVYTADPPPARDLDRIRRELGIPVQSIYRSGEALKIAFECELQSGLHIHPDLCAVSIVDCHGATMPPGETGEIVISNLLNRATVLLNYRIGDRGALSATACPCGRSFPLLERLDGRSSEVLRLPDGRCLETSVASSVFKNRNDVVRYQIVQRGAVFRIRVQPRCETDAESLRNEVVVGYRRLLGPDVTVEVELVAELDGAPGDKWRPIVVLPNHAGTRPDGG
jgi:phenylacetate-CoA ligase